MPDQAAQALGRKGGLASRSNLTPKQLKESVTQAANASWAGHQKGNKECACARCASKK